MRHQQSTASRALDHTEATIALEEVYLRARQTLEAGQTGIARALYLRCLALDPDHGETHHDLGVMAAQDGDNEEAVRRFERAVRATPDHPEARANLCLLLTRVGRCREAVAAGEAAVAAHPGSSVAHTNFGSALEAVGDIEAAARSYRRAADAAPDSAGALMKLANALRRLGRLEPALDCIDRSLSLDPDHYGARIIRALLRDAAGQSDGAGQDFVQAYAVCPPSAEAHKYLGVICIDQGRLDLAVEILRHATLLDPANAEAFGNLGLALQKQGRLREAFDAYARTVTLDPRHVVAQCNLGGLLADLNQLDAAVSTCRLAIRIDPTSAQAHVNLAVALRRQEKTDEAIGAFREALRHQPDMGEALMELCDLRQQACDWPDLEHDRAAALEHSFLKGRRVAPFQVMTLADSPLDHQRSARLWADGFRQRSAPLSVYAPRPAPRRTERLRVGYLSADLRTHATTMLIAELFERHDRARFDVFAYSCGDDDGSAMRRRLIQGFDHFVDIRPASHAEAAQKIHDDGIDVLIDLKGYTREARPQILSRRPAPIQVNFLGFPGTLGAPFIDYIVADAVVIPPEATEFYDEKIVRLPHSYQPNDRQRLIAASCPTRADCGLPERGFVFCCFNNSYKITGQVFAIWMRLLRATPGSVLWVFEGHPSMATNLRREAAALNVAPDRLVFAPRILPEHHLARLPLADLFLDTLPVNAHTTASEALWAGLPVLTCLGKSFAARVAGSLIRAVGLPELVTTSLADYEALATALARDSEALGRIRRRLVEGRATSPLFDTPGYTRHFETALTRMVERMDLGQPPESFAVEP